ncbi:hypothetical protein ACTFIR_011762 [Dictyostelium discoideum]
MFFNDYGDTEFKETFVFTKSCMQEVYKKLKKVDDKLTETHIIHWLDYIRYYNKMKNRCKHYNVCYKTYANGVWRTQLAGTKLKSNISLKSRFKGRVPDLTSDNLDSLFAMLLDSCFFPYLTSDQSFYNPKYKIAKGLGFKYEMGCDPMGRIIWINGPYKASNHDVAIFRDKLKQSITLSDNELILADKGYRGEPQFIKTLHCKPKGGDLSNKFKLENYNLKSIRCMIEKIFNIFKRFEAFKQPWDSTIEKHQQAVFLVGYCINESYEEMELKQIDNSIEEEEDQEESNNIESLLHHLDETREVNEPPLHFTSSSESDSSETENHEKPPSRIRVSKTRDQSFVH